MIDFTAIAKHSPRLNTISFFEQSPSLSSVNIDAIKGIFTREKISPNDYCVSLCGDHTLHVLCSANRVLFILICSQDYPRGAAYFCLKELKSLVRSYIILIRFYNYDLLYFQYESRGDDDQNPLQAELSRIKKLYHDKHTMETIADVKPEDIPFRDLQLKNSDISSLFLHSGQGEDDMEDSSHTIGEHE